MRIAPLADGTTEVDVKLLPDGRACIHWLYEADDGLICIQGHEQLRAVMGAKPDGEYRLACRPKQNTINSRKIGSIRYICMTSNDLNQVTCPDCLATKEAKAVVQPPEDERVAQLQMAALKEIYHAGRASSPS
jgi:hypothetical protein